MAAMSDFVCLDRLSSTAARIGPVATPRVLGMARREIGGEFLNRPVTDAADPVCTDVGGVLAFGDPAGEFAALVEGLHQVARRSMSPGTSTL
jgi:hypothetical protein